MTFSIHQQDDLDHIILSLGLTPKLYGTEIFELIFNSNWKMRDIYLILVKAETQTGRLYNNTDISESLAENDSTIQAAKATVSAILIISSIIGFSGFFSGDDSQLQLTWSLINTLQIMNFVPLLNLKF